MRRCAGEKGKGEKEEAAGGKKPSSANGAPKQHRRSRRTAKSKDNEYN
jgi:hypothetical protein